MTDLSEMLIKSVPELKTCNSCIVYIYDSEKHSGSFHEKGLLLPSKCAIIQNDHVIEDWKEHWLSRRTLRESCRNPIVLVVPDYERDSNDEDLPDIATAQAYGMYLIKAS